MTGLDDLAKQINQEHNECESAFKAGVQHALNAGELLIQAKALCHHGEWGRWLKDNCQFSERTAQAYMRVARELPGLDGDKAQRVAEMSFRETLALLAEPQEVKDFGPEVALYTAELEGIMATLQTSGTEIVSRFKELEKILNPEQFKALLASECNLTLEDYRTINEHLESQDKNRVMDAYFILLPELRPFRAA
jgi:hypothetical protein